MKKILHITLLILATSALGGCDTGICDPYNWVGAPLGYGPGLLPFCSI